jgi:hypothetical protein
LIRNRGKNRTAGKTERKRTKRKDRKNGRNTHGRSKDGIEGKRERGTQEKKKEVINDST